MQVTKDVYLVKDSRYKQLKKQLNIKMITNEFIKRSSSDFTKKE